MASKSNHRSAFAADPKFLARLAQQGVSLNAAPSPATPVAPGALPAVTHAEVANERAPKEGRAKVRLRKVKETNMESRFDRLVFDPHTRSLTAFFPKALLLALNVMLRVHNAQTTSLKATWVKRVEALRLENPVEVRAWLSNLTFPLLVEEIYISPEAKLLDHESVAAACKPILDAFVSNGLIPDDNGKVIAQPLAFTERGMHSGIVLRFRPSPRPWGCIEDWTMEQARTGLSV